MAFIKVIEYHEAEGRLKEIYDDLIKSRGKLAEVHKIQSLHPESIVKHMELYMEIMFGKSPLQRYQREMIAVIVSEYNHCSYCVKHHSEALLHFWKDQNRVQKLIEDYKNADVTGMDKALCTFAHHLTVEPHLIDQEYHKTQLNSFGLDDRDVLDAALVVAYFNFVNRMVLGLGVILEADGGGDFNMSKT